MGYGLANRNLKKSQKIRKKKNQKVRAKFRKKCNKNYKLWFACNISVGVARCIWWCHLPPQVMMLGDSGVGKSSLINQFMSSEYMNTYDASLGKCGKCRPRLPGFFSARANPRLSLPWRPPWKLCMRSPRQAGARYVAWLTLPGWRRLAAPTSVPSDELDLQRLSGSFFSSSIYCQCTPGAMLGDDRLRDVSVNAVFGVRRLSVPASCVPRGECGMTATSNENSTRECRQFSSSSMVYNK